MSAAPQIAGFEMGRLLGRGGMAAVWQARQQSLGREVAIKVLSPAMAADPEDVASFYAEARAAAALQHPNIVQVYDAGCQQGRYFYVMELVNGYDVGQWLRRKGRLPLADALTVAESVAVALDHAWSRARIIHCDIKPENVMVDADGTIKVTDLGVARRLVGRTSCEQTETHITGTPAYMSPEQVEGVPPMDCRTDMYALGATLYHLLTGQMLFHGTDEQVMQLQVSGQAPDLQTLVPAIPDCVARLIEKLLAKNPAQRPGDWQAALHDLHRVRQHLAPLGAPLPPGMSSMRRLAPPREPEAATTGAARKSGAWPEAWRWLRRTAGK